MSVVCSEPNVRLSHVASIIMSEEECLCKWLLDVHMGNTGMGGCLYGIRDTKRAIYSGETVCAG